MATDRQFQANRANAKKSTATPTASRALSDFYTVAYQTHAMNSPIVTARYQNRYHRPSSSS